MWRPLNLSHDVELGDIRVHKVYFLLRIMFLQLHMWSLLFGGWIFWDSIGDNLFVGDNGLFWYYNWYRFLGKMFVGVA